MKVLRSLPLLVLTACFASASPMDVDEPSGPYVDVDEPSGPQLDVDPSGPRVDVDEPSVPQVVDACVATAFAWVDEARSGEAPVEGAALVFANYPLESPEYQLELYGLELWVVDDALFQDRIGGEESPAVVFGRREGDELWRVLSDPDVSCPALPEGVDWPVDSE